jgi:hypothetical protein
MIFSTDLQTQIDHIPSKGLTGLLDISVASDPNQSPECSWWPVLLFIIVPVERGLGGKGCCLLGTSVAFVFNQKVLTSKHGRPGKLALSLVVGKGREGRIRFKWVQSKAINSIREDVHISNERPSSMVVFESLSSKYLKPTCKNQK